MVHVDLVKKKTQTVGKPIEKNSYIIKESTPDRSYNLLSESVSSGYKGLCITRTDPIELRNRYNLDVPFVWLTKQKNKDFFTSINTNVLKAKIKEFIKANKKSIILLDRLDYLINMHGFDNLLKFIYSINDEILVSDAIFMLNVNPLTLSEQEITLLEQELHELPKPKSEIESDLEDDLHEILVFVNNTEKVAFKHVSKKFSITKTTTRKRINKLEERGLVVVKKNGRNKIMRITESGKNLL